MPSQVPTPVAAALGIFPTVLDGVRRLPARAVHLPVLALSSALTGLDLARREYDDLAARGERLLARLGGTSFDRLEDAVEDRLEGTPLAGVYDAAEDALEDAGEAVQKAAVTATRAARSRTPRAVPDAAGGPGAAAGQPSRSAAEQPKGEPTPSAPGGEESRVGTAATADVVQTVEQVVEQTAAPEVDSHDELPLPDYDHMTLGSLRGRLRSLTVEQLVQLRDYEKAHANRLPVVTMLDNRIAKLATDQGATTSVARSGAPSAADAHLRAHPAQPRAGS